jgi:hypothetical protein
MDFDTSEEQRITLDALVEAEIAPAVQPWRDATIPKDLAHALLRRLAPYGVGSGWLGESDGGFSTRSSPASRPGSPERRSSTRRCRDRHLTRTLSGLGRLVLACAESERRAGQKPDRATQGYGRQSRGRS